MKEKFFAGFRVVLPIILFIVILNWAVGIIFSVVEVFDSFRQLPEMGSVDIQSWIDKSIWLFGICVFLCMIGWLLGIIPKFPKVDKYIKLCLDKTVKRIPLLSHLYGITNQVADLQGKSDSFKSVVLVRIPGFIEAWTVGFITTEEPKFKEYFSDDDIVSVYVSMTPLTSGLPFMIRKKYLIQTNISVADGIAYIATAGFAGATEIIKKESHSNLEWDFFLFLKKICGCFL